MEGENIGIPVILQGLDFSGDGARRNSFSVVPQEIEPIDSDIRRNSIPEIPQEMEPNGGVIPQYIEPNDGDMRGSFNGKVDPSPDIKSDSVQVIPQEMKPNDDDTRRNSNAVIPQQIEPNVSDIKRNSIPENPLEMEPNGGDIRRNSILEIPQEIESDAGDIRRSSVPVISQEMEPDGGGVRRNSIAVIPQEIDPNANGIRRNSSPAVPQELEHKDGGTGRNSIMWEIESSGGHIRMSSNSGVKIQSRYLRAPVGSCHDYCKYGLRNASDEKATPAMPKLETAIGSARQNIEATTSAERKKMSTTSPKPSPDSNTQKPDNAVVTEKKVVSLKKETVSSKKVPSPSKEIGVCVERSLDFKVKHEQFEPSSLPGSAISLSNLKVGPKSFPDSHTQKLNNSVVTEKKVSSLTNKEAVSSKKVSSPKEIVVCTEELIDSKVKAEKLEPSSLPGSVLSLNDSKLISTINPKLPPDSETHSSVVTGKRVSSLFKDSDVPAEDSIDSKVKPDQLGPSSFSGSVPSLSNLKVISTINPEPSPHYETQKLDHYVVTEKRVLSLTKKETVSAKIVSTPIKETDVSVEGSIDSKAKPEQLEPSSLPGQGSSNQGKSGTRKSKEIKEGSSSIGNRKIRGNNARTSVLVEKKMFGPETVSLTSKHPGKKVSDMNTGSCKNPKGVSHLKDQNNPSKVEPEGPCNKDMPEKILYIIESNTESSTVEPTPNGDNAPKLSSSSPLPSKGKSFKHARKGIGSTRSPPSSEKKNLKRTVNGGLARSASTLCPGKKGLRRSTRTSLSSSSPSSMSKTPSESTYNKENGATSQQNTTKTENQTANVKVERKSRPRRSGILSSESKNSSPRKLTFRRGRVVEVKPENNTPRRLKFRRVRLVGEIQNSKSSNQRGSIGSKEVDDSQSTGAVIKGGSIGRKEEVGDGQLNAAAIKRGSIGKKEVGGGQSNATAIKRGSIGRKELDDGQSNGAGIKRKSFRRKEVDDSQSNGAEIKCENVVVRNQERDVENSRRENLRRKEVGDGVLNGAKNSPEKVVLRHQALKGRKDVQKLFNNVIEETASRLVVSRKSKVKALVGAFETVISLQDTRPSATADAS